LNGGLLHVSIMLRLDQCGNSLASTISSDNLQYAENKIAYSQGD
jgi:hypothetical protein